MKLAWKGNKMKNIFVEGIQGSGKSTLSMALRNQLQGYKLYLEGDLCPVDLAWCSYMDKESYDHILERFSHVATDIKNKTIVERDRYITAYTQVLAEDSEFYKLMESHEIYNGRVSYDEFHRIIIERFTNFSGAGNIFECALFQNPIESLLLFYEKSEGEIIEFYQEISKILMKKDLFIIYLDSSDIRANIEAIRKERVDGSGQELWFPLMLNYLKDSPFGVKHPFLGIDEMIAHFMRRRDLEVRILQEVFQDCSLRIPAKSAIEEVLLRL